MFVFFWWRSIKCSTFSSISEETTFITKLSFNIGSTISLTQHDKIVSGSCYKTTFLPHITDNGAPSASDLQVFATVSATNPTLSPPRHFPVPSFITILICNVTFRQKQIQKFLWFWWDSMKCTNELCFRTCFYPRFYEISYYRGIFPNDWKTAQVHPVPKKPQNFLPENKHLISISRPVCSLSSSFHEIKPVNLLKWFINF